MPNSALLLQLARPHSPSTPPGQLPTMPYGPDLIRSPRKSSTHGHFPPPGPPDEPAGSNPHIAITVPAQ
jgi:hypothetical protein